MHKFGELFLLCFVCGEGESHEKVIGEFTSSSTLENQASR